MEFGEVFVFAHGRAIRFLLSNLSPISMQTTNKCDASKNVRDKQ